MTCQKYNLMKKNQKFSILSHLNSDVRYSVVDLGKWFGICLHNTWNTCSFPFPFHYGFSRMASIDRKGHMRLIAILSQSQYVTYV